MPTLGTVSNQRWALYISSSFNFIILFNFFLQLKYKRISLYLKKLAHVPKILNSMEEIKRDFYLNQLIAGKQNGLIKIVTGIRRCGHG